MIIIYTTCKSDSEAKSIAGKLIEKGLAGCAVRFAAKSMHKWKGEMKEISETVLLLKTTQEKFQEAKKLISSMHSYEVPCILKLEADGARPYLEWLEGELR
jgi:periplasmic divalent cation tolerance protein